MSAQDATCLDLLTWQLVDSALPTGAFAHSSGIEAAYQHGEVADVDDVRVFIDALVRQAGWAVLPLMNAAHLEPRNIRALDELADAFLTNAVANRASRVQGRALVATASRVWPTRELVALKEDIGGACGHVAPVSGATYRLMNVPLATAQRITLYGVARSALSAAVRLGIVGSYDAQRLQSESACVIDETAGRCAGVGLDDLAQIAPVLDAIQAQHDRLYTRLFQS